MGSVGVLLVKEVDVMLIFYKSFVGKVECFVCSFLILINEVLDYFKIEVGCMKFLCEMIYCDEIIEDVVEEYCVKVVEKGLIIECEVLEFVIYVDELCVC